MKIFGKILNAAVIYFSKKLHLRCLTGNWIRFCIAIKRFWNIIVPEIHHLQKNSCQDIHKPDKPLESFCLRYWKRWIHNSNWTDCKGIIIKVYVVTSTMIDWDSTGRAIMSTRPSLEALKARPNDWKVRPNIWKTQILLNNTISEKNK